MITYRRLKDGGFVAGCTVSGRTAYAYPTSSHATEAKRYAGRVANEMMKSENALSGWRDGEQGKDFDARNWARLAVHA